MQECALFINAFNWPAMQYALRSVNIVALTVSDHLRVGLEGALRGKDETLRFIRNINRRLFSTSCFTVF